ncbi:hypothetical protein M0D69_09485 [Caballeronia sp. SEWSISQ10-4 2]|uniref:hypothetical protein n=1 Tax=Caballeronia sp. SEWSISQ10-4 2 TaxID=2937438 RepID=UPI00264B2BAF|nr:hypothetical protein [Caballeronia sp. SEWSISQ10-4 2]MDN7178248.1 hypothetical protein [Caballeronia sp. SEWSISQ10-4 2]
MFSMSLEILLWVKTDEIGSNVAVSAHQKAADDNRELNVAKTQLPQPLTARVKRGTPCGRPENRI